MWGRLWRTARHAGKSTAGFVNNGTWRQHARQASSAFARLAEDTPTGTRFSALFAAAALSGHVANSDSEWNPLPVPQKDTAHKRPGSKFQNLPEMIEACFPAICKIQGAVGDRRLGGGSAFVIDDQGTVVTNDHVFEAMRQAGATEMHALFDDGRSYIVEPIASDTEADIAVGRIRAPPGTRFPYLPMGSSGNLKRGDTVAVLGAPLGGSLVPAVGVLGGIRYVADDEVMNYVLHSRADWCLLQVDASMSSGSSGGPIVNADGEVVGVSVMVQMAPGGPGGGGGVGSLNYGVAVDQAFPIIRSLLREGTVKRSAIGMTIVLIDTVSAQRELASTGVALLPPAEGSSGAGSATAVVSRGHSQPVEFTCPTGLLVTYAVEGRPAADAGLREGDVILEINGRKMVRKGDYFSVLGPVYESGKTLTCKVWRPTPPATTLGTGSGRNGHSGPRGHTFTATIRPEVRDETPADARKRWGRRR